MNDNKELSLIPKYEKYMEYMIEIVLINLPRTEKFNIGNEFKIMMYQAFENIMYLQKLPINLRLGYLNKIDAEINIQRVFLRIMQKNKWIDNKRFDYIMHTLIKEIGAILGGLIKYYAKDTKK